MPTEPDLLPSAIWKRLYSEGKFSDRGAVLLDVPNIFKPHRRSKRVREQSVTQIRTIPGL